MLSLLLPVERAVVFLGFILDVKCSGEALFLIKEDFCGYSFCIPVYFFLPFLAPLYGANNAFLKQLLF